MVKIANYNYMAATGWSNPGTHSFNSGLGTTFYT